MLFRSKVVPINILRKINFFSDILCVITLIKIFYKAQPNAVHSITPKAGLLAMLAAYLVCTPLRIHTFTGQVWANKKGLTRLLLKMIDFLISVSPEIQLIGEEHPTENHRVRNTNIVALRKNCNFIASVLEKIKNNREISSPSIIYTKFKIRKRRNCLS